eukprot:TRINITY_DN65226_c0_g1_i1.p1 TRINITY_DN65226_c0_g1~~TRINITY_DN65226_c0_g1_i1.p1  ORF type:complete len:343 (+),score=47.46 TRINITY_DN65226_c0_g1_i1:57-1085(+)
MLASNTVASRCHHQHWLVRLQQPTRIVERVQPARSRSLADSPPLRAAAATIATAPTRPCRQGRQLWQPLRRPESFSSIRRCVDDSKQVPHLAFKKLRWGLLTTVASALLVGLYLTGKQRLMHTLAWALEATGNLGYVGVLLYLITFVLSTQLMIPSSPLEMAAGVLFARPLGIIVAVAAAITGKQLTGAFGFFLGQTFLRRHVREELLPRFQVFETASKAVDTQPFMVCCAIRMAPIPTTVKSLGVGACGIPFRTFLAASLLFGVPWSIFSVLVGSSFASLPELLYGGGKAQLKRHLRSFLTGRKLLLLAGLTSALCIFGLISWLILHRRLRKVNKTSAAQV